MSVAVKTDPELWSRIVAKTKKGDRGGPAGVWSARKAQLAVAEYKSRGGKYKALGEKSRDNSLTRWSKEDWGYIDNVKGNRYLPAKVRRSLSSSEKRIENRRKREATRKGKTRASYSKKVASKLRGSRPRRPNRKSKTRSKSKTQSTRRRK